MKRILFGTSALGLTLATFGMPASTVLAGCSFGTNAYICGPNSTEGEDLSNAGNAAIINFVEASKSLTIRGSKHNDVATVANEIDGDPNSFGQVNFSGLFMGAGDDTLGIGGPNELATGLRGEPGKIFNSQISMEDGDDSIVVGGVIQNDAKNTVTTGIGNDTISVNAGGSVFSSIMLGEGNDKLINDGTVGGQVEMGDGDDLVQTSSSFNGALLMGTGDDTLHAIDKAPQRGSYNGTVASGFTMFGGAGFDRLILDGVSTGANINISEVSSFETLIKQSAGTWMLSQDNGSATDSFREGIYINEGTVNFLDNALETYVYNKGIMTGKLTLMAAAQAVAGDPVPFNNASAGTVAGNLTFSGFDDIFINDGHIANLHTDGITPVQINMGEGNDQFRNTGTISGSLHLGGGTDRFVMTDDKLFNKTPPGNIDGGADWDTIELAGTGGRMMEINASASAVTNFENLDVSSGAWSMAADQAFNGDMNLTGGTLSVNTNVSSSALNIDGGTMLLNGTYQGLATSINSGSLNILNGLLKSNTYVGQSGDLHGNGRVTGNITVDGKITPDEYDGVGTLTVDGNLTVNETGTIVINVDPKNGTTDRFDVSGFLTIDDGAKIEVVPISDLEENQEYTFDIAKTGLIKGEFGMTGAFRDYTINYGPDGKVSLAMGSSFEQAGGVTPNITPTDGTNTFNLGLNGNQIWAHLNGQSAAFAIATGTAGSLQNTDLHRLWTAMNTTASAGATAAQIAAAAATRQAAVNAMSSEFYSASYLQARSYANYVRNKTVARIDDKEWCATMQGAGEANCRAYRSDAGDVWGSLEVLRANDSSSNISSFKGRTIAGLIGMDRRLGLITTGLVGGFGSSTADVNTKGTTSGMNASLGGYFSLPMEVLNIDGNLGYTYGSSKGKRTIAANTIAGITSAQTYTGTAKTHQFGGGIRLTQEYKNESGLELQPEIGLAANYMVMPGFTETNSGGSNLALKTERTSHFDADVEAGLQVRYPFRTASATFIPEVRAKVTRKITGKHMDTQARFIGSGTQVADFQIQTALPETVYQLGMGLNYELDSGLMVFGDYDYRGGSDIKEHQGSLGVRYDF